MVAKTEPNLAEWTFVYDEANQLIETHSPLTTVMSQQEGRWVSQIRSILTRQVYDSFGNVIETIRDAEGLKQRLYYVYDNNNRKLQTIYPNVLINSASKQALNSREEQAQTLTEEQRYNAFGELIATKDRAGNWRHRAYDYRGQLVYILDAQGALTGFSYDVFGNLLTKTAYANCLSLNKDTDYSTSALKKAQRLSTYDREESYSYDLDNRLIETTQNAAHSYNAATKHYETLRPYTRRTYNAFGEVIEIAVKRNEVDWARTSYWYDQDGLKIASLDAENYLNAYGYNRFGELIEEVQYANRATDWNTQSFKTPLANSKDRHLIFVYDQTRSIDKQNSQECEL